jgi:hypothetical protein
VVKWIFEGVSFILSLPLSLAPLGKAIRPQKVVLVKDQKKFFSLPFGFY